MDRLRVRRCCGLRSAAVVALPMKSTVDRMDLGSIAPGSQIRREDAPGMDEHMTVTMDLDTERFPLGDVLDVSAQPAVRPFGLSVARWDVNAKFERELIHLDPDTQIGMFGELPIHTIITAATTCQQESDGQTPISLDYPVDDK